MVGQEQVTEVLENSLKNNKVSHAYLFVGPRGCGKTSVARIFAHEVNGFKYEIEDDYVDIIEIDGASNRGIDNIRELREKVAIAPTAGKYKVYIIDEVHMLTKEAFNALLKTLEEPPEHAIFIMATTDAYKVPVTITSRAQTFTFKLANSKVMFGFLKSVCEKEKIKIEDGALTIIVKRGGGSFRDSLSLLDQISTLTNELIAKELVVSAMGLPEDEKIDELLSAYGSGDVVKITTSVKELLSSGVKAETLAEELIGTIIDNPQPGFIELLAKLPEVRAPFAEAKLLVALCRGSSASFSRGLVSSERHTLGVRENRPSDFDWEGFVERVGGMNDGVAAQLKNTTHELNGGTLNIYPIRKITRTILMRENNKKILVEAAGGLKVVINEVAELADVKKDDLISKMSAIMGGEVQNDGGDSPF